MECPKCHYVDFEYGIDGNTGNGTIKSGEYEDFFELPIKMERDSSYERRETVYGCPKCGTVFINV